MKAQSGVRGQHLGRGRKEARDIATPGPWPSPGAALAGFSGLVDPETHKVSAASLGGARRVHTRALSFLWARLVCWGDDVSSEFYCAPFSIGWGVCCDWRSVLGLRRPWRGGGGGDE